MRFRQELRRGRMTWTKGCILVVVLLLLIVEVIANGTFETLRSFGVPELAGNRPNWIIEGPDGLLYGTTLEYGRGNWENPWLPRWESAFFSMNRDGTGYRILRRILAVGDDGERNTSL